MERKTESFLLSYTHKESNDILESFELNKDDIIKSVVFCMNPKYKSYSVGLINEIKFGNISSNELMALATLAVRNIASDLIHNGKSLFDLPRN